MIEQNVGFALCGSFCTFEKALLSLQQLCGIYKSVTPVMSESAYATDTRFGSAQSFIDRIESVCGKKVIHTIKEAEPFGPKALLDILIIAPCTGNTIAKLAGGITDTTVTMAAKAHLRNNRPVLIAVSTNDGLTGNAANIGLLQNRKNYFFVPYYQDDPVRKPGSIIADFNLVPDAVAAAHEKRQLQPVLCQMPAGA